MTKTYSTARQLYYWPNMKKDIEDSINFCPACQEQRNSNARPRLGELTLPISAKQPMLHIGCDSAIGKQWLTLVDRYSGFD